MLIFIACSLDVSPRRGVMASRGRQLELPVRCSHDTDTNKIWLNEVDAGEIVISFASRQGHAIRPKAGQRKAYDL